jgi:hypothetical protein
MEKVEFANFSDSEKGYDKSNLQTESGYTFIEKDELKDEQYDPSSDEPICCIELINNNKIYLKYDIKWTIIEVIVFNNYLVNFRSSKP